MKKFSILVLSLLLSTSAYAGTITLTYDDAHEARLQEGITHNGKRCNNGESLADCTQRLIAAHCTAEVKGYEQDKDAATARDAVSNITLN